jgi:hypothetical protein
VSLEDERPPLCCIWKVSCSIKLSKNSLSFTTCRRHSLRFSRHHTGIHVAAVAAAAAAAAVAAAVVAAVAAAVDAAASDNDGPIGAAAVAIGAHCDDWSTCFHFPAWNPLKTDDGDPHGPLRSRRSPRCRFAGVGLADFASSAAAAAAAASRAVAGPESMLAQKCIYMQRRYHTS